MWKRSATTRRITTTRVVLGARLSALGSRLLLVVTTALVTDLTPAQRAIIDRGELVIVQEDRPTSPWPAMTAYAYIDATPEEAVALFTDYDYQATFVPSLTKSRVSRVIDKTTTEVDFGLEVPFYPDEEYTVRDRISLDSAGVYRVDWTLVRASSTKGTVGHARFSTYRNQHTGRTGTLMEYFNFVTPGSRFAGIGFVRTRAMKQVGATVRALARQVEKERTSAQTSRRLAALHAAVR